ncbi:Uroporphyrinogen-III decarboxylase [Halalkaliarchaeum sp. AArc-CO]|uniref:uroporphyrinogen decarboxylase family protein n=1 Tax=unclassified Halalkaliarchaeum TaxID=2678344 RepID=UPI00217CD6F1|nr:MULTISPECIES: uroporphyrinogen decarboxylase family protein [unclassified Halalkaliarchaeum]MDR5674197.1 uroporphyrinogen decarboxylase family protein [Halalkaliarchaeum sp. AArc-GB]UWG50915.1 Uroporphyrinogen-III decarboxylase [Halalkaliarchaeum sp. AArc-CO]
MKPEHDVTLENWENGVGIDFEDEAARDAYRERTGRFAAAIRGEEPDRIPTALSATFYPVFHAGITPETAMNDAAALAAALEETVYDLEPDCHQLSAALLPSAKMLEMLDYNLYAWPGDGASPDTGYQALEKEYMGPDDYEQLLQDPTDFWLRHYIPEIVGALEPFRKLPHFTDLVEIPSIHFMAIPFGLPDVQEALETLMDAGEEALRWQEIVGGTVEEVIRSGYPRSFGGFTKAPYDTLGDTLRGTKGIAMDLKRQPDVLEEAVDSLTPTMIEMGIRSAQAAGNPLVFIPLHKGADGFMSDEEFRTFYWPQLRDVIDALTDAGLVPWLFAEGSYDDRLEAIADQPDGNVVWQFDRTDMRDAKEALGDRAAIAGNVHSSLLNTKEPEDVDAYCRELIEDVGPDGFILAPGVAMDEAKPENVRAMIEAPRKYC